jgi:tRNA(Ile)-lysidine synthase
VTPPIETSSPNPPGGEKQICPQNWSRLSDQLAEKFSLQRFAGVKIVLGVSGGADSVAMLRLILDLWKQLPRNDPAHLVVAHYNHRLRGEASNGDQHFVNTLSASLGLPCHTAAAEAPKASPEHEGKVAPGGEAAFRKARYAFLETIALSVGARYVMVAHTAEDNVETVLHNLFRGTGSAGLAGMARHRAFGTDLVLVRPLLSMRRSELREGLKAICQPWREDASNSDDRYQRNWIRGHLLPFVRARYPNADDAILRMIQSQAQNHALLSNNAKQWIDRCVEIESGSVIILRVSLEPSLIASVAHRLWDRMRWPRRALTAKHLHHLHQTIIRGSDHSFTLPSDVQVIVKDNTIMLCRQRKQPL